MHCPIGSIPDPACGVRFSLANFHNPAPQGFLSLIGVHRRLVGVLLTQMMRRPLDLLAAAKKTRSMISFNIRRRNDKCVFYLIISLKIGKCYFLVISPH